jgi:hypothetical protein
MDKKDKIEFDKDFHTILEKQIKKRSELVWHNEDGIIAEMDNQDLVGVDPEVFKKGKKFDNGKTSYSLLEWKTIEQMAELLTYGAKKYDEKTGVERNWKHVENPEQRYYDAAMRHIREDQKGNYLDNETDLPHLVAAMINLMFLKYFKEKNNE